MQKSIATLCLLLLVISALSWNSCGKGCKECSIYVTVESPDTFYSYGMQYDELHPHHCYRDWEELDMTVKVYYDSVTHTTRTYRPGCY